MIPSAIRCAAVALAVVLGACASGPNPVLPDGAQVRTIGPDEIWETLSTHTLERDGWQEGMAWRYANRHLPDGTLRARLWLDGEVAEEREGFWEIGDDGLYCRTWPTRQGVLKQGCFTVGRTAGLIVLEHASGSRGDAGSHVYRARPGDPLGLETVSKGS